MYKAELALEKRLNDLALANVPSTSYENIVIVPKRKPESVLQMSPDEFDLRDLAYDQKMNTISKNAMVDRLGWKPSKIKSDVTKAMIQDYQLEQMKNIKKGVYIPSSLDLDLVEDPEPPLILTDRQFARARADLRGISERAQRLEAELANLPTILQEEHRNWEARRQAALSAATSGADRARVRRDAQDEFDEINRQFNEYQAELQTRFANDEGEASAITQHLEDHQRNRRDYQQQVAEVQQENAKRRKRYEDQVLSMNRGVNHISMLPDETIDEYKQRLDDIGDSTYDTDAIEQAASLLYTDRLREKMMEITRDEVVVGDFIRRLNTQERYSIVKVFDPFKKKVLEVFGQDNKFMSADDLFNIASVFADEVAIKAVNEPPLLKEADARPIGGAFEAFAIEEGSVLEPREPESSRVIDLGSSRSSYQFSTEATKTLTAGRRNALLKYSQGQPLKPASSFSGAKQPESMDRLYEDEARRIDVWKSGSSAPSRVEPPRSGTLDPFLRPAGEIPFGDLQIGIQALASEVADEDEKKRLLDLLDYSEVDLRRSLRLSGLLDAVSARRGMTGRGIDRKYPKILPFGLIEVSPHKLFYENILKITRRGKHLTGFPNVKVSDAFVRFMFKIIDGGQPTMREGNALSAGEKALFDSVVFTAGLAREVETTGSGVKQDLKNRLSLIEGEIEAGNTNPELIKEARKILQHLARMKIIGHRPATEHLKMLIRAQRE